MRDILDNKRSNWAQYLDLTKAEESETSNTWRTCDWILKTDGYAVSILLSKFTAKGNGEGVL
jgi:hypothetical protein